MSKTVTLRLDENIYQLFLMLAKRDNRPLSNFIETAALRFVESKELVDEFEMNEIHTNRDLNQSLKRALRDVKAGQGHFV